MLEMSDRAVRNATPVLIDQEDALTALIQEMKRDGRSLYFDGPSETMQAALKAAGTQRHMAVVFESGTFHIAITNTDGIAIGISLQDQAPGHEGELCWFLTLSKVTMADRLLDDKVANKLAERFLGDGYQQEPYKFGPSTFVRQFRKKADKFLETQLHAQEEVTSAQV